MNTNVETAESPQNSTLFRTAKPTPEPKKEPKSVYKTVETDTIKVGVDEMPLNLYREAGKTPYFLTLIESGEFAYKTFNVKELSETIDEYLLREGTDKESYKKAFDELIKRSKAEGDVYSMVDKLHEWVRIQNKLLDTLKEKKEFEAKSPDEMNSRELERYINGKT